MPHRVVTFVARDARHLPVGGVDHRRVEQVVRGGAAGPGVAGVLFGAGHEADAIRVLVPPCHGCGLARPGLFMRQVTSDLRGARRLVSYDSAASHTGPCLRGIAWRGENATGALVR